MKSFFYLSINIKIHSQPVGHTKTSVMLDVAGELTSPEVTKSCSKFTQLNIIRYP